MNDDAFADLKEAMEDALAFEQGKRRDLKLTRLQASPFSTFLEELSAPNELRPEADR